MRTNKSHHWKSKLYNDKIKLTWFHWMISFIWACISFSLNLMSAPRWFNASTEINMNEQDHNLNELTNDRTEAEHAYSFICVLFPLQFNAIWDKRNDSAHTRDWFGVASVNSHQSKDKPILTFSDRRFRVVRRTNSGHTHWIEMYGRLSETHTEL